MYTVARRVCVWGGGGVVRGVVCGGGVRACGGGVRVCVCVTV